MQGLVDDMYNQFVGMVAEGRHMDLQKVKSIADGRAYTGRQALNLGLIDAIGGEQDARHWLAESQHVPATLPVKDVEAEGLARRALTGQLMPLLQGLWKILITQRVSLDGPRAIWQPSGN
jgi:protease-4